MATNGTSFDIALGVSGAAEAASGAAALDRLTANLSSAKDAASQASEAMKAGEASYRSAEAAANRAAAALEKINVAVEGQQGKLQAALDAGDAAGAEKAARKLHALVEKQTEAASKASSARAALEREAASLDKLRAASDAAEAEVKDLTKAQDSAKKAADAMQKAQEEAAGSGDVKEAIEGFSKLGGTIGGLNPILGDAIEGMKKLSGSVGAAAGPYVALAAVVVALTTAVVAGTAAILKFAIANTDAARTAQLLSAGIAKTEAGGALLEDTIKDLSKRVPHTRDELRNMAADLAKSGLQGQELADALEDAAVKAAKLKWGPNFARQMTSLDKLSARFRDNLGDLFELNIEPLLDGLEKIVDLFDEQSVTGQAIKTVFVDLFQRLIDGLAELTPKIVAAFIQFQIWVLKALIAIKPFGSTILTVGKMVGTAALVIVGALAAVGAVIATVVAAQVALVSGLMYLGTILYDYVGKAIAFVVGALGGAGKAFDRLVEIVTGIPDMLSGISLSDIGLQLVEGLAKGIVDGGAAVLKSITGVVSGAIDAAKGLLGIASPSKVFAEIGEQTAAGMAGGVEDGTADVDSAVESMVEAPEGGPDDRPAGGSSVNLAGAVFNFYGVEGAEHARDMFGELLTRIVEGDAAQLGAEAAPAA